MLNQNFYVYVCVCVHSKFLRNELYQNPQVKHNRYIYRIIQICPRLETLLDVLFNVVRYCLANVDFWLKTASELFHDSVLAKIKSGIAESAQFMQTIFQCPDL